MANKKLDPQYLIKPPEARERHPEDRCIRCASVVLEPSMYGTKTLCSITEESVKSNHWCSRFRVGKAFEDRTKHG